MSSGVQLLTDNTVPSADRWALISEHPAMRLVALCLEQMYLPGVLC